VVTEKNNKLYLLKSILLKRSYLVIILNISNEFPRYLQI